MTARALQRIAADLTAMIEHDTITPTDLRTAAVRLQAQAEMIEAGLVGDGE